MSDTGKRRESIGICVAVIVAYLAMYVLTLMYEDAIAPGMQIGYILRMNMDGLVIALIVALIPYEKISYIWHRDFVQYWFGVRSRNNEINMMIEAAVLYGISFFVSIWLKDNLFQWKYRNVILLAFILTVMMAWIVVNSFKLIKSNVWLFTVDLIAIATNSFIVYILTNNFYKTALTTCAMFIGWNVCNFLSDRKYKLLSLLASILFGAEAFGMVVDLAGKYRELDAWIDPTKMMNIPYSSDLRALKSHTLRMPDDFPWFKQFDHPFISINHFLGTGALMIMFLAFVIITIAFVRSYKILSENRFKLLIFLYSMFAVTYIYTLSADLGFVPAATNVPIISVRIDIIAIGIMVRLFLNRPVPQRVIENLDYSLND
ncbi:MAG: hypothetical protein ACI4FV_08290 [Lachnospiraceae bacterium]